jgi:hypothetical protein
VVSKQRGRGVYILEKRYVDMTPAEKAAYRRKIIEDYMANVKADVND